MSNFSVLASMGINPVALITGQAQSSSFDFSILYKGTSSATSGQVYTAGNASLALKNAEEKEAQQLEQVAKQPDVQRDLERYKKVVASAETIDDVLDDPTARKVFMTAVGLRDSVSYVGMAKKVLNSDITDPDSQAAKLTSINRTWYDVAAKYNFNLVGASPLKISDSIEEISNDYIAEKRLDMLDSQLPGLGSAVLFKTVAASLDTPLKILGSAIGREVVTTALNIPKQIAVQSVEAQMKAVSERMDPKKLSDAHFVDRLVQRYLINLNGGTGGVTA